MSKRDNDNHLLKFSFAAPWDSARKDYDNRRAVCFENTADYMNLRGNHDFRLIAEYDVQASADLLKNRRAAIARFNRDYPKTKVIDPGNPRN